jgi:hypothetical protein
LEKRHTAVDGLELALGFTFVLDANSAASSGRVGGHYGGLVCGGIEGCKWIVVRMFKNKVSMEYYGGRTSRS